jgi:hypothetical protein
MRDLYQPRALEVMDIKLRRGTDSEIGLRVIVFGNFVQTFGTVPITSHQQGWIGHLDGNFIAALATLRAVLLSPSPFSWPPEICGDRVAASLQLSVTLLRSEHLERSGASWPLRSSVLHNARAKQTAKTIMYKRVYSKRSHLWCEERSLVARDRSTIKKPRHGHFDPRPFRLLERPSLRFL